MTPRARPRTADDAPNQTADRVLQVLSAFLASPGELGVVDVGRMLDLDKSVVHRILATLAAHRYVEQNERTRKYRVGVRSWELGQRFRVRSWVNGVAVPLLADLLERHGSTGYVASLEGGEILYLATVDGAGPFQVTAPVGSRAPAVTTALGRAILAEFSDEERGRLIDKLELGLSPDDSSKAREELEHELAATRDRGYAVNHGESRPGVGAIGAAIKEPGGRPVAAVSVAFPMLAEFDGLWEVLPPEVMRVADQVSQRLG